MSPLPRPSSIPSTCPECARTFANSSGMLAHRKAAHPEAHSADAPFRCPCGYAAYTKASYNKHKAKCVSMANPPSTPRGPPLDAASLGRPLHSVRSPVRPLPAVPRTVITMTATNDIPGKSSRHLIRSTQKKTRASDALSASSVSKLKNAPLKKKAECRGFSLFSRVIRDQSRTIRIMRKRELKRKRAEKRRRTQQASDSISSLDYSLPTPPMASEDTDRVSGPVAFGLLPTATPPAMTATHVAVTPATRPLPLRLQQAVYRVVTAVCPGAVLTPPPGIFPSTSSGVVKEEKAVP